jgi:hypothetical protein
MAVITNGREILFAADDWFEMPHKPRQRDTKADTSLPIFRHPTLSAPARMIGYSAALSRTGKRVPS